MSTARLFVVTSSGKGPRCYVDRDQAVIDAEHYAPPAEVVAYVPESWSKQAMAIVAAVLATCDHPCTTCPLCDEFEWWSNESAPSRDHAATCPLVVHGVIDRGGGLL